MASELQDESSTEIKEDEPKVYPSSAGVRYIRAPNRGTVIDGPANLTVKRRTSVQREKKARLTKAE